MIEMPLETVILILGISNLSSMATGGSQGSGKCDWKTTWLREFVQNGDWIPSERHTEQMGKARVGGCIGKWPPKLLAGSGPGHVGVTSWRAYHSKRAYIPFYK